MKQCVFLVYLILASNSYTEIRSKIHHKAIGEITLVNKVDDTGKITIYDTSLYNEKNKENLTLFIINTNNDIVAHFIPIRIITETPNLILYGVFKDIKHKMFVGLRVGFIIKDFEEPNLPDRFREQKDLVTESYNEKDQTYQVLVPKGLFIYGTDEIGTTHYTAPINTKQTNLQKRQQRKRVNYFDIEAFYMDEYEITNQQFSLFLKETLTPVPANWNNNFNPNLPVNNVSYDQASKYCNWANKRLATELEWEKATRGPNLKSYKDEKELPVYFESESLYTIGRELNEATCNTIEQHLTEPTSVLEVKDESYWKTENGRSIKGLCGNVAEWTSSWFLPYRGNYTPNTDYGKRFKVIRGGAYNLPKEWAYSYARYYGGVPTLKDDFKAGIRCVKDIH